MTTLTEPAADAAIIAAATTLALPTVRTQAGELADAAARDQLTHRGYLAELLSTEVDDRAERRRIRRIREARFPRLKHLNDFDTTITPINGATIATLTQGDFVTNATPVVFLGDSGTGKTHLLIGTGIQACHKGLSVRYTTTASLVNELVEAQDEHTLTRLIGRYGRLDLLLIDELGYLHLDPRGAELLFQVITEREERASIAVATNAPFSEWATTFTDPRLCSAIIDRLTFNAHIIETGTDSYRLRTTRTVTNKKPTK
jgi:DNA replication protein DnaC